MKSADAPGGLPRAPGYPSRAGLLGARGGDFGGSMEFIGGVILGAIATLAVVWLLSMAGESFE